jgi:hypothetical protein
VPRFKRIREFLEWTEHVRLVVDVVLAIAGLKAVKKVLSYIPQISHDWATVISWLAAAGLLYSLVIWQEKRKQSTAVVPSPQQSQNVGSIPAVSTIIPGIPGPTFDTQTFFRQSYYSSVTAETEKNMGIVLSRIKPADREGFFLRFMGVGIVQAIHEFTWLSIFRSQFLLLLEMNQKAGYLSLASAKNYYDKAATGRPDIYSKYSFDQWIDFLKTQQLVLQHPSEMLEITIKGKDFLKYCTHWGHYAEQRIA